MIRRIGLVAVVALLVASCGGPATSAPEPTPAAAATGSATAPGTALAFPASATAVQSAVVAEGFACVSRAVVAGFRHLECPKAGVADIDVYSRGDGTVAGVDARALNRPMTTEAMFGVVGPALDAAAGTGGWADIADAIRAAGSPKTMALTVLPGSRISVSVGGYADGELASVTVLAPDLAAIWGHPPLPVTTPAATASP